MEVFEELNRRGRCVESHGLLIQDVFGGLGLSWRRLLLLYKLLLLDLANLRGLVLLLAEDGC